MRYRFTAVALLLVLQTLASPSSAATAPRVKWTYEGQGQLYCAPIVADLNPAPGLETIVSDAEVRKLRCIDARGKQLWELGKVWKKRLIQGAALSTTARPGKGTLLIGNGDGTLAAIDAATGKLLWQKPVGAVEWGSVIWADLYGTGRDCAIAVTLEDGIVALDAAGKILWRFAGRDKTSPHSIQGGAAVVDLDGNGKRCIVAATTMGPFCLNPDGTLRWERYSGDDFKTSVTVADADRDGKPEVYCGSNNDDALWCFDGLTGAVRWRYRMLGMTEAYPGGSIPVADVDGDGRDEILVADNEGHVSCLDASGQCRWVFQTARQTSTSITVGDIDGDGEVETMVACGDHYLYCLDSRGVQKWRFGADLRIAYAPTFADVDGDGRTDLIVSSSDHRLRCLTMDGRYVPALIPWPTRRFDAAASGAPFRQRVSLPAPIRETRGLFLWGGFETAKSAREDKDYPAGTGLRADRLRQPKGWCPETGAGNWAIDAAVAAEGRQSLRVAASHAGPAVSSDPIALERELAGLTASIRRRGADAQARIRWSGFTGTLREDALAPAGAPGADGWVECALTDARPPSGARWASLVLDGAGASDVWWDDARIQGAFLRAPAARALVNQVGYDIGAPKLFTVQANFPARDARYELVNLAGAVVHRGALTARGRIVGAYRSDWGFNYWRGDLTAFDQPGKYRVRVILDGIADTSWPFEIGRDLIWMRTSRPAYRFFTYQRCGYEIPGFHRACHLDDCYCPSAKRQLNLVGGWHDAGDYNKYYNAPYVIALGRSYEAQKALFDRQDVDRNKQSDFLDEVVWGAQHCARMIQADGTVPGGISSGYGFWGPPDLETDNLPNTGDERMVEPASGGDPSVHISSIAKAARYSTLARAELMPALMRGMKYAAAKNLRGPDILSAAMDLYAITKAPRWAALAKSLFPGCGLADYDMARAYDALFHEDHSADIRKRVLEGADNALRTAGNPFGIPTGGSPDAPNFFSTPASEGGWHVGNSSTVMNAASLVAQAYAYSPDPRYLAFVYDQFNWILGNNPYDLSLMEGAGTVNPPSYHQRLTFGGVPRGAVPGSVVNGITWRAPGEDRPYFDMRGLDIADFEPNEVWLPHNTAYVSALSHLMMSAGRRSK